MQLQQQLQQLGLGGQAGGYQDGMAGNLDMLRLQQQQQLRQAAALKGLGAGGGAAGGGAGAGAGAGGVVGAGGKLGMAPQPDRFGLLGLLSVIRMTGEWPISPRRQGRLLWLPARVACFSIVLDYAGQLLPRTRGRAAGIA